LSYFKKRLLAERLQKRLIGLSDFREEDSRRAISMTIILAKIIPFLVIVAMLAVMTLFTMAVGWVSGKLIRKVLGIGGK
jgi:hypothetical protein